MITIYTQYTLRVTLTLMNLTLLNLILPFFLSIRPPAYKTVVLCTGINPVYKTMVLYCTIFLELGIRVPNIQF